MAFFAIVPACYRGYICWGLLLLRISRGLVMLRVDLRLRNRGLRIGLRLGMDLRCGLLLGVVNSGLFSWRERRLWGRPLSLPLCVFLHHLIPTLLGLRN